MTISANPQPNAKPKLSDLLLGGPGHDGYAFNADVYYVECGQEIIHCLYQDGKYDNGDSGDSNEFPQPIFFGESDCPQHCSECGEYMYGEDSSEDEDENEDTDEEYFPLVPF